MKKTKRDAKFFCESCGSEVPRNAKTCPTCGKFFASVRCPKCGNTGTTEEFVKGCPECGYAVHDQGYSGGRGINYNKNNSKEKNGSNIFKGLFSSGSKKTQSTASDGSLPIWIYLVCVAVLVVLMILLYSCL